MDKVRVLRIIEYVGEREAVEETVANSIHGTREVSKNLTINAATIGMYPEVIRNKYLVDISEQRLAELKKAEKFLNALNAAGVDNWDGYDFAMEALEQELGGK